MKGRRPWNKPSQRKADVYKLLVQTGGEARWKTLKAHLDELRLGPTTLKQTLDEMVAEESITKEARLGVEGAEVWYKIQVRTDEVWGQFQKGLDEGAAEKLVDPFPQLVKGIKEKAAKLEGAKKEAYVLEQMQKIVKLASESYLSFLGLYVRGAQYTDKDKLDQAFDYFLRDVLVDETKAYLNILSEFPSLGLKAIHCFLIADEGKLEEVLRAEEENKKAKTSKMQTK